MTNDIEKKLWEGADKLRANAKFKSLRFSHLFNCLDSIHKIAIIVEPAIAKPQTSF